VAPDAKDIENLEQAEVDAILKSDLEALDALWSDDLILSSNENLIFSKPQIFALFKAGLVQLETLERIISKTVVKDNVAFVAGHQKSVAKVGPTAGTQVMSSYMSSWVREDTGWRLAARHQAAMVRLNRG
jgi:ketosteroid isomerase-like protein